MATCELKRIIPDPIKKKKKVATPLEKAKFLTSKPKNTKPVDTAPYLEIGQKYYYEHTFSASDVIWDADEWADAARFRPAPYALILMRVKRKNLEGKEVEKTIPGWWTGSSWDGRTYEKTDKVLYWKNKE